ncbi:hypothetical protein AGMMS49949_02470 [Alphaproteobacteria bacterium]|nr:hypothetical protein AGMMS49949_02470 [Alphaproteobacteria bacterium]
MKKRKELEAPKPTHETPEDRLQKKKLLFMRNTLAHIRDYDLYWGIQALQQISSEFLALNKKNSASAQEPTLKAQQRDAYLQAFGPVQFRATVRYATPATTLASAEIRETPHAFFQPILWVNFTGLAGVQGPLAFVYTERVFRNLRNKDGALASFLDIFNHRIVALHNESQKWVPGFSPIRPEESSLGRIIAALGGLDGSAPSQGNERDKAIYVLTYKNLFWKKVRSTAALTQILQSFFKTKVCIKEFVGNFLALPEDAQTRMGKVKGDLYTLGVDTFLGNRIWHQGQHLHIILQNLNSARYEAFNTYTGGPLARHLKQICTFYAPSFLHIRYFLEIKKGQKKALILGQPHFLGFDSWLGTSGGSSPLRLMM